jgi:hypothetical protein
MKMQTWNELLKGLKLSGISGGVLDRMECRFKTETYRFIYVYSCRCLLTFFFRNIDNHSDLK